MVRVTFFTLSAALCGSVHGQTPEKLVSVLKGMHNVDMGEFVVGFSSNNHRGSKFVDLMMIGRGGKFLK